MENPPKPCPGAMSGQGFGQEPVEGALGQGLGRTPGKGPAMGEDMLYSGAVRAWAEGLGRRAAGMGPAKARELILGEVLENPAVASEEEAVWAAMVALEVALKDR